MCSYCGEGGASIVCVQRLCKKVFHYPCGVENGSQHNFYDKFQLVFNLAFKLNSQLKFPLLFRSFCKQHRPVVRVLLTQVQDPEPAFCAICMDEVQKEIKCLHAVWAPCCKKNSWLHRICVQVSSFTYLTYCFLSHHICISNTLSQLATFSSVPSATMFPSLSKP